MSSINIIPILIGFVLFNCNSSGDISKSKEKSNQSKSISNNPYFPIAEGNKWEYLNAAQGEETEQFKVEVQNVKENNEAAYFDLSSFPFFSRENKKITLEIGKDGEIVTEPFTDLKKVFIPAFEKLKQGYTWSYGEWNGSVSYLNDTVVTENGTYTNCLFLNFSISITFAAEIWLAKDVGIVKWGYNRTNPPTFKPMYYVLKNLTLSK